MTARIVQLSISSGGVPKKTVPEALVDALGLERDKQKHTKIHGGPDRAVCLFSLEVLQSLQAEGHPIYPGSTGENILVSGLDWPSLAPGMRLALGPEVVIELTRTTTPCKQIAGSFADRDFNHLGQPGRMRWYGRVIAEGVVRPAMAVRIIPASTQQRLPL
jgi:MOSC domain-containing protein YiiM